MVAVDPSDIEAAVRALIVAERTNLGIEVSLPVAYADGETVTVAIEPNDTGFTVHDAGFGALRLVNAGMSLSRALSRRIATEVQRYHCSFTDGRVCADSDVEGLALTACLVANASRTVADHALELRRQTELEFRLQIADRLREVFGARVRDGEEVHGQSGRRYRVASVILDRSQIRPQNFISMLAHRNAVPHNFAMFFDLRGAHPYVENDAVIDDTSDIRAEDRMLLESVSTVIGAMEAPHRFRAMASNG